MNFKRCCVCHEEKPLTEFGNNKRNLDGLQYACKVCYNERSKKWAKKHRSKIKTYPSTLKNLRYKILKRLGAICNKCGFLDIRALQIDHIDGGGTKERKKYKNYYGYIQYLRSLSDIELKASYQCLCANCNQIKKIEKEEHPNK